MTPKSLPHILPASYDVLTITVDSNVLIGGLHGTDNERAAFQALMRLKDDHQIEIGLASRFEQDKLPDKDIERVKEQYAVARLFPVVPSPLRVGASRIGVDIVVDGNLMAALERIFPTTSVRRNTTWDVDHLYGHLASARDYFLTWDKGILRKEPQLAKLGIIVLRPDAFLKGLLNRSLPTAELSLSVAGRRHAVS